MLSILTATVLAASPAWNSAPCPPEDSAESGERSMHAVVIGSDDAPGARIRLLTTDDEHRELSFPGAAGRLLRLPPGATSKNLFFAGPGVPSVGVALPPIDGFFASSDADGDDRQDLMRMLHGAGDGHFDSMHEHVMRMLEQLEAAGVRGIHVEIDEEELAASLEEMQEAMEGKLRAAIGLLPMHLNRARVAAGDDEHGAGDGPRTWSFALPGGGEWNVMIDGDHDFDFDSDSASSFDFDFDVDVDHDSAFDSDRDHARDSDHAFDFAVSGDLDQLPPQVRRQIETMMKKMKIDGREIDVMLDRAADDGKRGQRRIERHVRTFPGGDGGTIVIDGDEASDQVSKDVRLKIERAMKQLGDVDARMPAEIRERILRGLGEMGLGDDAVVELEIHVDDDGRQRFQRRVRDGAATNAKRDARSDANRAVERAREHAARSSETRERARDAQRRGAEARERGQQTRQRAEAARVRELESRVRELEREIERLLRDRGGRSKSDA